MEDQPLKKNNSHNLSKKEETESSQNKPSNQKLTTKPKINHHSINPQESSNDNGTTSTLPHSSSTNSFNKSVQIQPTTTSSSHQTLSLAKSQLSSGYRFVLIKL
jgi:hypothetical protein